jgi:hypothetical protein
MVAVARVASVVLGGGLRGICTHGGRGIRRLCGEHGHVVCGCVGGKSCRKELIRRSVVGRACRSVHSISYRHYGSEDGYGKQRGGVCGMLDAGAGRRGTGWGEVGCRRTASSLCPGGFGLLYCGVGVGAGMQAPKWSTRSGNKTRARNRG